MKLPAGHPYRNLPNDRRTQIMLFYYNKYFSLWVNSRKIKGLSYEQNFFVMSSLWERGTCLAINIPADTLPSADNIQSIQGTAIENNNTLVFTPYSPQSFNIYYQVNRARPIKLRGANFIPNRVYNINEDAVILWANSSHTSVFSYVDYYIKEIADTQIAIDMNLYVNTEPKLVGVSPEDERAVRDIEDRIHDGEKVIFTSILDPKNVVPLVEGGANYIVEDLFKHKQEVEAELMTILGIRNVNIEKNERLTETEASSNNVPSKLMQKVISDTMQEGIDKMNECFGLHLELVDTIDEIQEELIQEEIEANFTPEQNEKEEEQDEKY